MTETPAFRRVLITGASSGLGAALGMELAAPGVSLVLVGRNSKRLDATAQTCRARGADVETCVLDVADAAAVADALEDADARQGFDLVIANAGVAFGRETPETARLTVETNVIGVLNTLIPIEPRMVARGSGQIGLVSSLAAFRVLGGPPAYSASKAWVRIYGEALRGRLARKGIGVTVICPGFIDTPMVDDHTRIALGRQMIGAKEAAKKIVAGLKQNAPRVTFPRGAAMRVWWLSVLPVWYTDRKIRRKYRAAAVKWRGDSNTA
ncbi:MAG: SDR family NAD(P)-dependent oxidoreductase [Rhodobacter sp.]|nr:SDR family NAD(P)-dependent oxidoreductase [Rhodobacter sp.]